jgi:hypothetical protein
MPDGIDADDGAGVGGVDHLRAGVVGTGLGRVVDAGGQQDRCDAAWLRGVVEILRDRGADAFLVDRFYVALSDGAKLGFTKYERRSVRFARRAGFSTYVSLRLMQTT